MTAFMEDCTERAEGSRIERGKLFKQYEMYCIEEQHQALRRNAFYADLRAKGYIDPPYYGTYYFKDIRWKSEIGSAENTPESEFTQINCTNGIIPFD